jgi:hypothetical protein
MKISLLLASALLVACDCPSRMHVDPDGEIHSVSWPGGSCNGKIVRYRAGVNTYQFGVKCSDGKLVFNLTNFTLE